MVTGHQSRASLVLKVDYLHFAHFHSPLSLKQLFPCRVLCEYVKQFVFLLDHLNIGFSLGLVHPPLLCIFLSLS